MQKQVEADRVSGKSRRGSRGLLLLSFYSLLLAGGSAWVLLGESAPYLFVGQGLAQRVLSLAEGNVHFGHSRDTRDLVLKDCVRIADSLQGLALPTARRSAALATCGEAAARFAAESPTYSYARYVEALLAGERTDYDRMNEALSVSRSLAPTEQWLAELRVKLAESYLADLHTAGLAGHEADLALLVGSQRGVRVIARRYVAVKAFRERITAIAEKLSPDVQRRFVTALREEAELLAPPEPPAR